MVRVKPQSRVSRPPLSEQKVVATIHIVAVRQVPVLKLDQTNHDADDGGACACQTIRARVCRARSWFSHLAFLCSRQFAIVRRGF